MKTWLIRHPNLTFERPLSQNELIEKIESGEIQAQDELCVGGGYWFSLSEVDEVRKHLGDIRLKSMMPENGESTSSTRPGLDAKTLIIPQKGAETPVTRPQAVVSRNSTVNSNEGVDWAKLIAFIAAFLGILIYLWTRSH